MKIKTQLAENYRVLKFGRNPNFALHSGKTEQFIQDAFEAGWNQAFRVMQNSSIFEYHSIQAMESDNISVQNVVNAIQEEIAQLEDEEVPYI